jgi:hypothetical protein
MDKTSYVLYYTIPSDIFQGFYTMPSGIFQDFYAIPSYRNSFYGHFWLYNFTWSKYISPLLLPFFAGGLAAVCR